MFDIGRRTTELMLHVVMPMTIKIIYLSHPPSPSRFVPQLDVRGVAPRDHPVGDNPTVRWPLVRD